jgi:hypothetical protein
MMDFHRLVSGAAVVGVSSAPGMRVHVSDASPRGFCGQVTALYPGAVTVTRDSGARELVILSRRHVTVVSR